MINWKKNSIVIFILAWSLFAEGQQFAYRSGIDSITNSGFYSITITPELSAHLKTDLSDFRIVNEREQWIPHVIRSPHFEKVIPTKVVKLDFNTSEDANSSSVLLIENKENLLIGDLMLQMKNTIAGRVTSLSGSYDNKLWYTISDSLLVTGSELYNKDENTRVVNLPPTKYTHYKLTIRNAGKDPLNIVSISATSYPEGGEVSEIQENPTPTVNQRDSGKLTIIKVSQASAYQFDNIQLDVKRPAYYDRLIRIYLNVKPGVLQTWESPPIEEINFSSLGHVYPLSLAKAKEFYILILNQDNPPLEITGVKTFQRTRQAIAYLEKGTSYHLLLDNPKATSPNYDLDQFHSSIPVNPPVLQVRQIVPSVTANNTVSHTSTWWIWLSIAGITLLLAYLSWGLTRDMKKKNEAI